MKRLLLAGLLALPLALARPGARADEHDAYASLVGMAGSASADRGPQAGEIPPDLAGRMTARAPRRAEDPESDPEAQAVPERVQTGPVAAAPGPQRQGARPPREEASPSVLVPPSAAPRVWTKVFASLIPPMRRAPAFEVEASTRPATAASDAGAAQGLRELFAAATAPAVPPLKP